jgi:hypothetical protein
VMRRVQDDADISRRSSPHYAASSLAESRSEGVAFSLIMSGSRGRVSPLLLVSQSLDCGRLIKSLGVAHGWVQIATHSRV